MTEYRITELYRILHKISDKTKIPLILLNISKRSFSLKGRLRTALRCLGDEEQIFTDNLINKVESLFKAGYMIHGKEFRQNSRLSKYYKKKAK